MKIAIAGIGNCASSLVQAIELAKAGKLSFTSQIPNLAGFDPKDIAVVAAFDVDRRKVGLDLGRAIFADPNSTTIYYEVPPLDLLVSPGVLEDGIDGPLKSTIPVATEVDNDRDRIVSILRSRSVDTLVLYLPVGAQRAAEAYADAALLSRCALINCTPALIACSPDYVSRFKRESLPLLGDDMRSHIGSTTIHHALLKLLAEKGAEVTQTYQLNFGGNNDFLNMRDPGRAAAKRTTKHAAVRDLLGNNAEFAVGPSDYVPFLHDHKVGYIRVEGKAFLGMPFSIELRLEVEDSPNAAPIALDAIRLASALRAGLEVDEAAALSNLFKRPKDVI
jgi:myo-inositol-1-phosphate synthase